jgi:beta-glucosidase
VRIGSRFRGHAFPEGTGAANSKGLAFYDRFLDEFLANGIAPFPTLYHWDLPRALQDRGGWENRDTAEAFAHYAGYVAEKIQRSGKALFHAQRVLDVRRTRPCDGRVRARIEAAARRPEPAPPSRAARPRACGPSDPRAFAPGTQIGPAENVNVCVPVVETPSTSRQPSSPPASSMRPT